MSYSPSATRYQNTDYRRCGRSGLRLPRISLGLWHNFGSVDRFENARSIARYAFDQGITHFDIANNYGPLPGSAESNFGRILKNDFARHRDELVISSKAGYHMWEGPYGEWGSKKHLIASLNQSLQRAGLEYFDIFYSHRPDPETPVEETVDALEYAIRSGKALYVGLSNYRPEQTRAAYDELNKRGIHCLVHQPRYSMLDRWVEDGLLDLLDELEMGAIVFSPLEQGILSKRYLNDIPADSRATKGGILTEERVRERQEIARALDAIARERGQTLAQMAIAWVLKRDTVTSALIGASSPQQLEENLKALENTTFSPEELKQIDVAIAGRSV